VVLTQVRHVSRPVIGKAKTLFARGLYSDLNDAIREGISNSMSWMHVANIPLDQRKIYITKNVGATNDMWIEDYGTGITDYEKFKSIGHDPKDEVHNERIKDPEFISQIGIGINSLLWLSKDNTVKFYSVSLDSQNRKNGLIATLMMDKEDIFFLDPPERPDSQYVLDHVGLRVVIKNAKDLPMNKITQYVSRKFMLKLKDYQVYVKDSRNQGNYSRIHPSTEFCSKHMHPLFRLSDNTEVRGDIHIANDTMDSKVILCIKKVENSEMSPDYLARGIITCNSPKLEFRADRSGMIEDEETLFPELKLKLNQWLKDNNFVKPAISEVPKIRNVKGLEEVLSDIFFSLSEIYPDLSALITGQPDTKGIAGRVESAKQNKEWEIHKENQKIMITDIPQDFKIRRGTRGEYQKRTEQKNGTTNGPEESRYHHGYEDGGKYTVLRQKNGKPENSTGLIRPMPPTELLPRRNGPVVILEQYEDKEKRKSLRIVINIDSPLSDIIISSVGAKQRATVTPYYCKAVVDYLAKINGLTTEQYAQMWEKLQIDSYRRTPQNS
jgi:hypothetical protein